MNIFNKRLESCLNSKNQAHWNCAYHQGQRITNFCLTQECLLPLCPQCVKVHIQEHSKMNIHGNFQVLQTVISNVKTQLRTKLQRTNKMKNIVQHLSKNKDHQIDDIVSNLRNFKQELIRVINEHFRGLQDQIKENLSKIKQKFNDQVQRNLVISKNLVQNTKKSLENLNSSQCMEAIINTFTELKKKENLLDESCKKIQQQSLTRNLISINRNCINQIIDQIQNNIELTNVEIPEYELINSINSDFKNQKKPENLNQLKYSARASLAELKINNEPSFINQKFQAKVEDGLIDRLSKTTERLQNDLDNLKRNVDQNQRMFN